MSTLARSDDVFELSDRTRFSAEGADPGVLADIYQEDCNIAVWQRELAPGLKPQLDPFLASHRRLQASMIVSPDSVFSSISQTLGDCEAAHSLSKDIAELVDMFCYLFELKQTGLRLTTLDRAMCPKFHVDRVPCRLVTTYQGTATEWLPHDAVDRTKLGRGSEGKPDEESGLFQDSGQIRQLSQGDVALLKGELWEGNEGAGLVHRSPQVPTDVRRLLLTLDFA
jgi:hypothetical protein